jgi:hypothetical protein
VETPWKGTRQEFEREACWRATIQRANRGVSFILEGEGEYAGNVYEYTEGEDPSMWSDDRRPVNLEQLEQEEEFDELKVLKGKLPIKP